MGNGPVDLYRFPCVPESGLKDVFAKAGLGRHRSLLGRPAAVQILLFDKDARRHGAAESVTEDPVL